MSGMNLNGTPYVSAQLQEAAALYQNRNFLYGDSYRRVGPLLSLILRGQTLDPSDEKEMNRLALLVEMVTKISRYGQNFNAGGHDDSLDDLSVYSMMLKGIDND